MLRGRQLAVNQINAKRGIRGRKLELRIVDDSGNEDTAVRVAEQLYADPAIVAVVGHLSSGTSLAAARVYAGGATPTAMISPSASSPDLSGISPYVFRVCPSDLQHGPQLARFAWHTLGARRAGIIYLNSDYGRGGRRTFAAEFARLGGIRLSSAYLPDRRDERNIAFVADYARAFPGQRPDHRGAGAYDIVLLLARAMDQAGADRRAVRDYLARVGRGKPPFEGVTGSITVDRNRGVAGKKGGLGVRAESPLGAEGVPGMWGRFHP